MDQGETIAVLVDISGTSALGTSLAYPAAAAVGGAIVLILVITVLSVLIPLSRAWHVNPVEVLGRL